MGITEITEDAAASLDEFKCAFAHGYGPPVSRFSRSLTGSISAFGVLIPVFDFFRNACRTQSRPATPVTYTTRQASVR